METAVTNQYTVKFLERMYFNLPPLVPADIVSALQVALNDTATDGGQPVSDIEDMIIVFSKKIWPYTRAFEELCSQYENELGEKLLGQKAGYNLRRSLEQYKQTGGSWRNLYIGSAAGFFTPEERLELHQLLVDIGCDIREFARQAALMTDRTRYEERIAHYAELNGRIETELSHLRALADNETEHNDLAAEIRDHVRGFELGLAKLGPAVDYKALCKAHEHFTGRKKDFKSRIWVN